MFYAYIIYSPKLDKYYVGNTQDYTSRLARHNRGDGSLFTKKGKPWELVYVEEFSSRQEAVSRELQIKKMKSRTYIEKLISSVGS